MYNRFSFSNNQSTCRLSSSPVLLLLWTLFCAILFHRNPIYCRETYKTLRIYWRAKILERIYLARQIINSTASLPVSMILERLGDKKQCLNYWFLQWSHAVCFCWIVVDISLTCGIDNLWSNSILFHSFSYVLPYANA